ncbi:MAG: EamA family transporter [Chloroflexota bacterium]|nr:EamA family transporter [Chloroflexota bacterium]
MRLRQFSVLLLLGAIWGSAYLFIELALGAFRPAVLVAVRLVIAAACLLAALYARGLRLPAGPGTWGALLLAAVIGVDAPFLLIAWGQQAISSGMTGILTATTPLFTLPLAALWTRAERPRAPQLAGVALGFVGVLVAVGVAEVRPDGAATGAYLAVLGASLCYAVAGIYGRHAFRGLPTLVPAAGQVLCAALTMVPVALLVDGLPAARPSAGALGAVLALAIPGTAGGYILFYWLLERTGATRTSMVTYIIAPLALVFGALFLGEPLAPHVILGLALVIGGIALANGVVGARATRPSSARPAVAADD